MPSGVQAPTQIWTHPSAMACWCEGGSVRRRVNEYEGEGKRARGEGRGFIPCCRVPQVRSLAPRILRTRRGGRMATHGQVETFSQPCSYMRSALVLEHQALPRKASAIPRPRRPGTFRGQRTRIPCLAGSGLRPWRPCRERANEEGEQAERKKNMHTRVAPWAPGMGVTGSIISLIYTISPPPP